MADPKLTAKISADSTELDKSLQRTSKEIDKVAKKASAAERAAGQNVARVADELNKSGSSAAQGLGKMAAGMSKMAAGWLAVVGVIKQVYDIYIQYVVKSLERTLELSKAASNSLATATDATVSKWHKATEALKEYYELQKRVAENPSAANEERLRQSRENLDQYGIRGNGSDAQLDFVKEQEIKALTAAINMLERENTMLQGNMGALANVAETMGIRNSLQQQINANRDKATEYMQQRHDLQHTDTVGNYRRLQLAQQADEAQTKVIKAQEEQARRLQEQQTAEKAYEMALKTAVQAQDQLSAVRRQQARDARANRIAERRDRIQQRMATFGFALDDGFDINLSGRALSDRRRQLALDASISNKLATQQAGGRVHWTTQERRRIEDYQRLQNKDRALDAAQKQMEAADKLKQAADALKAAADARDKAYSALNAAEGSAIIAKGWTGVANARVAAAKDAWWTAQADAWAYDKERGPVWEAQQAALRRRAHNLANGDNNLANRDNNQRGEALRGVPVAVTKAQEIDQQNAKWLEGIYNNTKDIGGNIFVAQ